MFTSSADVFRIRQSVADLRAYLRDSGSGVRARLVEFTGRGQRQAATLRRIDAIVDGGGMHLSHSADIAIYDACLLAAALPSDDYPLFTFATAVLLSDRLGGSGGTDDLYWNWQSFHRDYELADPPVRAALLNAYRFGARTGAVSMPGSPDPDLCQTQSRETILAKLDETEHAEFARLLTTQTSAQAAGAAWGAVRRVPKSSAVVSVFRHLYERPASIEPPAPTKIPLIPWSPD